MLLRLEANWASLLSRYPELLEACTRDDFDGLHAIIEREELRTASEGRQSMNLGDVSRLDPTVEMLRRACGGKRPRQSFGPDAKGATPQSDPLLDTRCWELLRDLNRLAEPRLAGTARVDAKADLSRIHRSRRSGAWRRLRAAFGLPAAAPLPAPPRGRAGRQAPASDPATAASSTTTAASSTTTAASSTATAASSTPTAASSTATRSVRQAL